MPEESVVSGSGAAESAPAVDRACFLDRELSWLQFNLRVLREAGDRSVPLLERLKFLEIYFSNLDEFFMVRVGSLTHRSVLLPYAMDPKTGWTAAGQVRRILQAVARQQQTAESVYRALLEDLRAAGIDVLDFRHLSKVDEVMTRKIFAEARPLLAPRVVDARHPLPFLGNREEYVSALLGRAENSALGLVSLYRLPPWRVYEVDGRQKVAIMSELVRHYMPSLFKKEDVRDCCVLRVTRNADVFIEDDLNSYDADFRASMEKMLRKRKRQQPVRLQIAGKPSERTAALLAKLLGVPEKNMFVSPLPLDLSFGGGLRRETALRYGERRSVRTVQLRKGDFFPYLEERDLLLSFPYQSMTPFIEMLYEAADDPQVLSIRITLYRLAASSKLAAALAYAADRGKDVLCLLELRARFDERNNIDYSEVLEDAGCTVIYGLPEQKVHCKLCLITRRKGEGYQYFTQVGTGNYNEVTSELYCDLSLITSDEQVGRDAAAVFEALSLAQLPPLTEKLWVAPLGFKSRLLALLDREIAKGEAGFAALKVNSLNDLDVMEKLIAASRAGVRVELFIRGICCLRPGLEGYTENIIVKSVVGRYLEHSRIFVFGRGGEQRVFIGSGDLLNRNTRRRVEAFIEVVTPDTRAQVLEVMDAYRDDREKGWRMAADGSYARDEDGAGTASHERLFAYFSRQTVTPLPAERETPPETAAAAAAGTPGASGGNAAAAQAPAAPKKKRGWLYRLLFGDK